ncbi:universal stress protein [Natrialba sp. INN-245]|uniref:universal stress protein n=1 Tax=Natrialba sp. INN-245 TaxID=2690967 RepID=UPI00131382CF|nr:universal stress protein [Natrialba sp. INN-245]MWV38443.1 universal stress protein [Natrialba sp. INN-245]
MYRVLIPVDPDMDRASAAADAVLSLPSVTDEIDVTVLSVFAERDVQDLDGGRLESEELFENSEPPESLEATAAYLSENGVSVSTRREHGDPAETILAVAENDDVDTIVMSARKRTPVGKALFGSVTQNVTLDSPVPVVIAGTA